MAPLTVSLAYYSSMKGVVVFLIFVINLFFLLFVSLMVMAGDLPDYVVAKSIPIYPHASNYKAYGSSGFPDGSPVGGVNFETMDRAETVMNFYETELPKRGWELQGSSGAIRSKYTDSESHSSYFHRKIGVQNFYIAIHKTETNEAMYKIESKEVSISVKRSLIER